VQERLVDAAEAILRAEPPQAAPSTTCAAWSSPAICRTGLSPWSRPSTPERRIVAWVQANLAQAAQTGHGWLTEAARSEASNASPVIDVAVTHAHAGMRDSLTAAWRDLLGDDHDRLAIASALTMGLVNACFRQIDAGRPVDLVPERGEASARALVVGLRSPQEHADC
jgi:hypothetical protein